VSFNDLQALCTELPALDFVVKSLATHCNISHAIYCTLLYYQSFWRQCKSV